MKSLFENDALEEIKNRISVLTTKTQPKWGSMDVAKMLKHSQGPLEVGLGHVVLTSKIGFFKRLLLKTIKSTMYNDKPWKQQLPTAKEYLVRDKRKFHTEKEKLLKLIDEFSQLAHKTDWPEHPFFGKFSTEQWGKAQYKHLDHHLRQFGV